VIPAGSNQPFLTGVPDDAPLLNSLALANLSGHQRRSGRNRCSSHHHRYGGYEGVFCIGSREPTALANRGRHSDRKQQSAYHVAAPMADISGVAKQQVWTQRVDDDLERAMIAIDVHCPRDALRSVSIVLSRSLNVALRDLVCALRRSQRRSSGHRPLVSEVAVQLTAER